jgi:hypothetical protein
MIEVRNSPFVRARLDHVARRIASHTPGEVRWASYPELHLTSSRAISRTKARLHNQTKNVKISLSAAVVHSVRTSKSPEKIYEKP